MKTARLSLKKDWWIVIVWKDRGEKFYHGVFDGQDAAEEYAEAECKRFSWEVARLSAMQR